MTTPAQPLALGSQVLAEAIADRLPDQYTLTLDHEMALLITDLLSAPLGMPVSKDLVAEDSRRLLAAIATDLGLPVSPVCDTPTIRHQTSSVYIQVDALADGRTGTVQLLNQLPDFHELRPMRTVWQAQLPQPGSTTPSTGTPVIDLLLSNSAAHEDPEQWNGGIDTLLAFDDPDSPERAFLRLVEAALITAGHFDARTQPTHCQGWGVGLTHEGDWHGVVQSPTGWHHVYTHPSEDDWLDGGVVAPLNASPQQVADRLRHNLPD
ncbi:hypothetical protein ACQEVX_05415 [Streptomyces syringium]|uniref:hypothetical protein n=1 Tax=Streptomyces syringium TaxID=76729 RepID=UPI003D8AF912